MNQDCEEQMISVVIPTYNRSKLLKRAVESVLNQTFKDFELIIVDDNSTDNTRETVMDLRKKDSRIKYFRHKNNQGGSAARNTGIKHAKGEFIALLDDDDEWLPEKLIKQMSLFEKLPAEYGVVYCGCFYISEKNSKLIKHITPREHGNVYEQMLEGCILASPTPLLRKECFSVSGLFDEKLNSSQDWDMWIRISKHFKFDFVPELLAIHRIHGTQISSNLNAKIDGIKNVIKKYPAFGNGKFRYASKALLQLGKLSMFDRNERVGRKYFINSIKADVFQRNAYIHFFLSFFPELHRYLLKKYSPLFRYFD